MTRSPMLQPRMFTWSVVSILESVHSHSARCLTVLLDNPESDIAGANAAGWNSVLVRTGVYDPSQGPPTHIPTREVEDVEEAVRWAIDNEFEKMGKL